MYRYYLQSTVQYCYVLAARNLGAGFIYLFIVVPFLHHLHQRCITTVCFFLKASFSFFTSFAAIYLLIDCSVRLRLRWDHMQVLGRLPHTTQCVCTHTHKLTPKLTLPDLAELLVDDNRTRAR